MESDGSTKILIDSIGQVMGGIFVFTIGSSFLINQLVNGSMNNLLAAIKSLLLIVHLPLLALYIPGNALLFFSFLQQIIVFDYFEQWVEKMNEIFSLKHENDVA